MWFLSAIFALAVMGSVGERSRRLEAYDERQSAPTAAQKVTKRPVNAKDAAPEGGTPESAAEAEAAPEPAVAPDAVHRFADLEWGASEASVRKHLRAKGYKFIEATNRGDLEWTGTVSRRFARVTTLFTPDGNLVKVVVSFTPAEGRYYDDYIDLIEVLTRKYGDPSDAFELYEYPYRKGDGHRDTAVRMGKATLATYWQVPENNLAIEILQSLSIMIHYEGPGWNTEARRRKALADEDL